MGLTLSILSKKGLLMGKWWRSRGNPHINLWPPSMWFGSNLPRRGKWKRDMSPEEAAQVIERFLAETSLYPEEWADFAETRQQDTRVERHRKRCDQLSPLVNRPGEMDKAAVAELKSVIEQLRSMT
jgi:hypothetical protein